MQLVNLQICFISGKCLVFYIFFVFSFQEGYDFGELGFYIEVDVKGVNNLVCLMFLFFIVEQ